MKPVEIFLPVPKFGAKIYLIESQGIYIFERVPGVLRTIACTHAGTGSMVAYDGVPNEDGFFPPPPEDEWPISPRASLYNGRPIYRANPNVMGSWMLDGGFQYGLTFHVAGGTEGVAPTASIVWMPYRARGT